MSKIYNVLFLCTGNSARSILAECILNNEGKGHFRAFSAGSHPKGAVHPEALKLLRELGYPTESLRSKSWDEFASDGAPPLDFVFTICDNAAGEVCPIWPGQPMTAHYRASKTRRQRRRSFKAVPSAARTGCCKTGSGYSWPYPLRALTE